MKFERDLLDKIYAEDPQVNKDKVLKLKENGYVFNKEWRIKDVCYLKWAYVINSKGEDDMRMVAAIIAENEIRIEKKRQKDIGNSGNSYIEQYFRLYGVMNKKEINNNSNYFHSEILYDCKSTPDDFIGWNANIYFMHVVVNNSDYNTSYKRPGFVKLFTLSIYNKEETSVEAGLENEIPTMRDCHNRYVDCHKNYTTKYTTEEWKKDLYDALNIFIENIKILYDINKIIHIDKNGYMFQDGKNYLTRIFYDSSGTVEVHQMEIFEPGKYRERFSLGVGKIPTFTKEINFVNVVEEITANYNSLMNKSGADKDFKY